MGANATPRNRTAIAIACLLALLGFATVVALSVREADAKSATVLGATKATPKSPCPDSKTASDCRITVKVTGIQTRADGKRAPFKVPADGRIVAWSVQVGKVDWSGAPDLTDALDDKYGVSKARLAVLKPQKKRRFKLTKQTPRLDLESRLGSQPIITLNKPLKVKKGQRIGLTMSGWFSGFVDRLDAGNNQWIASRTDEGCLSREAKKGLTKTQHKIGSTRKYACQFNGERLLYWAYFVPKGGGKKN